MTKNELEYEKARLSAQKFTATVALGKILIVCATVVLSIVVMLKGLQPFMEKDASVILALSKFVGSLNFGNWISYVLTAVATAAWKMERNGKKRAIEEKARYQKLYEENDPQRSTSGLTTKGDTP